MNSVHLTFANCRTCAALVLAFFLLLLGARSGWTQSSGGTVPGPTPNRLQNADFECDNGGYYVAKNGRNEDILLPNGWFLAYNGEIPILSSARIWHEGPKGSCFTNNKHVEKISGRDSLYVRSLDIETPPEPGKPFDAAIYQQAPAISGTAYSLSGWQLTLCGGSTMPNDCPDGYYMAKMLGIDPTGGVDINSPAIIWSENRNNFVDADGARIGWSNVRTSATAQSGVITVFARINSPFRWHGNHGFVDALALVEAPVAALQATTATLGSGQGMAVTLGWNGSLGGDIPTISDKFNLLFDVQYWHPRNGDWRDLQEEYAGAGSMNFTARCTGDDYLFRTRARAELPQGSGVWPNQRFPGVWSEPLHVPVPGGGGQPVPPAPQGSERIYLPQIGTAVAGC
jgi:hypothetical protein